MRAILPAALLALTSCAPAMVIPAEGTRLGYEFCGSTPSDIAVYRYQTRCPDLAQVEERARRVKESYSGCALAGVRVFVVGAYVMCNEEPVRGCTRDGQITVTADVMVIPTIEHEFRHVCLAQRGDALGAWDLDHREPVRALHGFEGDALFDDPL